MKSLYSILIQTSEEEHKYIVSLPELGAYARTQGDSYQETLKNAQEVLELLIEDDQARKTSLNKPLVININKKKN
ncbi:type II toxin-antitoxin system HicB family antitoxin [Gloeothece verrucosa]|uniref:HicB-like antitoxin of toxin-antitoxin system domain-containing protein n=1 Tax=Gloeothece verrucosa (strain PCC 7822) TaxID=497965 RepID=E0U5Y0_GLOV7|nr:type II toxin-antitoxin system HicB family antitoxin [Gloeothece verrucosa]ADN17089.1 protein of unknown function UPF0150 [Gloeothece verrucosa PCC 7822]